MSVDRRSLLKIAATAGVGVAASPATAAWAEAPSARSDDSRDALIGVQADNGARVIAAHRISARRVDITIDSVALGHTASARVLLPERFDERPRASWPVLYLLHGGFGTYVDWTEQSNVAALASRRDVLVVMPDGGTLGFYSDWWAHGGNKPGWETFHLVELRQILERGLRAADRRAIAGLSMGGLGAVLYAGRHPDLFRAAASFSGTLNTLDPSAAPVSQSSFPRWLLDTNFAPSGYDPLSLWGDPTAQRDIWVAHNPAHHVEDLRGVELFISCGNGHVGPLDPPGTDPSGLGVIYEAVQRRQNTEFAQRARSAGLDISVDFYTGSHSWPYWARELTRAWPMLMRAIGAGAEVS